MTSLSPTAAYHAEVQEQLEHVGRALVAQRAIRWAARGFAAGVVLDFGIEAWAWTRELVGALPLWFWAVLPLGLALGGAFSALFVRQSTSMLARRVDRQAGLDERAVTALELGQRGDDHPLAIAQMRDTAEHLRRLEGLEVFPVRAPKRELTTSAVVSVLAVAVAFAPNPWAVRARAQNPAIAVAREQAQRVERLAESLPADNQEIDQVRDLLRKGAQTIDARSSDPESSLNALEDLEDRLRQMSAGDDQLAAALAAVASALAAEPATSGLASAINTGDLREISRAARDLGQRSESMDAPERERVSRALRDASNRAGRASPSVAGQMGEAADALAGGGEGQDAEGGAESQQRAGGRQQSGRQGGQPGGRSAREALSEMGDSAAAAAERQRARSQLEGSRNALERALGRSQSRSLNPSGRSQSSGQRGQRAGGEDGSGASGQGEQGEGGSGEQNGGGGQGGEPGQDGAGGQPGQSGFGSGSQGLTGGGVSDLGVMTRPEQVSSGTMQPDETTDNPFLGQAAEGQTRAGDEQVAPTFTRRSTQGSDSGNIPLGLRDLVKDYFSALDQK